MTISSLIPTLQPMVEQLNTQFRFICFFVLTIAMIVRTGTGHTDLNHLLRPLVTNAMICAFIVTLPTWFNMIRDSFWDMAVQIQQDFTGNVDGTGTKLMHALQPPDGQINWLDVSSSIWRAVQYALAWIIVWIGAIIQLPMMFFQYIMECLCYLFLPIAISLFAFEGTKGLAIRYVQQTLAILAWPIGFAVVDMVGDALLNSIASVFSVGAVALGAATEFGPATMVVAGFVAVWLILGSLATPLVMQALFCSGTPLSSSIGHAIQYGLAAAGMARIGGGGGESPPSSSTDSAGGMPPATPPPAPSSGSSGTIPPTYAPVSPLPALVGSMQRAALTGSSPLPALMDAAPQPAPPPPALPPRGHTQPRSAPPTFDLVRDPSGEVYAMSVQELNQILTAIAY